MNRKSCFRKSGTLNASTGFTMIELVIVIFVASIFMAGVAVSYRHMQNSSAQQVESSMLQQNLRGVFAIMEREIRMTGMDYLQSGAFGITDIRKFSITAPGTPANPDNNGSPVLRMTLDLNEDGVLDADETITYLLYDKDGDGGLLDLARSTTNPGLNAVSGRELLAEGIEEIMFTYAFDNNDDERIDRTAPPGNNIIWAIDANNDGQLDSDLAGAALGYTVPPQNIRAVQVWVLARAKRPVANYVNSRQYTLGDHITAVNDNFRRWLLTDTMHIRNM